MTCFIEYRRCLPAPIRVGFNKPFWHIRSTVRSQQPSSAATWEVFSETSFMLSSKSLQVGHPHTFIIVGET